MTLPAPRNLPPDIAALERRRAELAQRIARLPSGASARRSLEARQREVTRALLVLETSLKPVPPTPEAPPAPVEDDDESNLMWWQK